MINDHQKIYHTLYSSLSRRTPFFECSSTVVEIVIAEQRRRTPTTTMEAVTYFENDVNMPTDDDDDQRAPRGCDSLNCSLSHNLKQQRRQIVSASDAGERPWAVRS